MKDKAKIVWNGKMEFEAEMQGNKLLMDVPVASGGGNKGPKPKIILLAALAGCTGVDVISILEKMKIEGFSFYMDTAATVAEDHPRIYTEIVLDYHFNGDNLPAEKISKAVYLSKDKYCAVSAMLGSLSNIKARIFINNEEI